MRVLIKFRVDQSALLRTWALEGSNTYKPLEEGNDLGANKPFLALIVLDLGNNLGKYGIEGATLNSRGNKQTHPGTATDNQVEQCSASEEKFDHRRFVPQDKVGPLEKIVAWCIDVTGNKRHGK